MTDVIFFIIGHMDLWYTEFDKSAPKRVHDEICDRLHSVSFTVRFRFFQKMEIKGKRYTAYPHDEAAGLRKARVFKAFQP